LGCSGGFAPVILPLFQGRPATGFESDVFIVDIFNSYSLIGDKHVGRVRNLFAGDKLSADARIFSLC
jgi:hypothetical protein